MSHDSNECNENKPVTGGEVSPQKLAANRANAQHSTGPKTLQGKEISSQNSRKHGFFARQPLPAGEEGNKLWEAYGDLVAGIFEYYQPEGYIELLLTEKIVAESIRYSRLLSFEAHYVGEQRAFHWNGVDRVLRFQSAINRQLFQAMHELERVQEKRKADPNPSNRSDREPDDEGAGRPAFDVQNDGPQTGCTNVETPANEIYEDVAAVEALAPHSLSHVRPMPSSIESVADGRQGDEPCPQALNYETNPTGARSGPPDAGTITTSSLSQKSSLADLVPKAAGLPPAVMPKPPGTQRSFPAVGSKVPNPAPADFVIK